MRKAVVNAVIQQGWIDPPLVGLMVNASFGEAPYLKRGQQTSAESGLSSFRVDLRLVFTRSASVPYSRLKLTSVEGRGAMIGSLQMHQ